LWFHTKRDDGDVVGLLDEILNKSRRRHEYFLGDAGVKVIVIILVPEVVLEKKHRGDRAVAGVKVCNLLLHTIFVERKVFLGQASHQAMCFLVDDTRLNVDDLGRDLDGGLVLASRRRLLLAFLLSAFLHVGFLLWLGVGRLTPALGFSARSRQHWNGQHSGYAKYYYGDAHQSEWL